MTELLRPSDVPVTPRATPNAEPLAAGVGLAAWVREAVWQADWSAPRSLQRDIGPSELGLACSRQIAFKQAGTEPVNMTVDPWASTVGRGMHDWMAAQFRNAGPRGRYLVEHPVTFRGVSGTLDLYDRRTRCVIDWKFPKRAKARRMAAEGPPRHYLWQGQVYAGGLIEAGESPEQMAVVYLPVDGTLADVMAFVWPVNLELAEQAVERLATVKDQLTNHAGGHPGQVPAQPSRLCPWCPFHRPKWTGDPDLACPGEDKP